jgi:hypothetical protein
MMGRSRHFVGVIVCVIVALASFAAFTGALAQTGFDRPGGDYSNFTVRSGDPTACATRCDREARCRAWSFSYPTQGGGGAICWLKSSVPARQESSCCVSGVKGSGVIEPRARDREFGIDRPGGDYRNFETASDPNGEPCAAACKAENRCRAWTYVRAGYITGGARCYLKSRVTPPRKRPCCVSGVVR